MSGFLRPGKQHVEIEVIAADGTQKIVPRKNGRHGGEFFVLCGIRRFLCGTCAARQKKERRKEEKA